MAIILKHTDAEVQIDELSKGKRRISVHPRNKTMFIPKRHWETRYPLELIKVILNIKGAYLCDEIMRDEDPSYMQAQLVGSILAYVDQSNFKKKKILDFGCGSGASTIILARTFRKAQIVGVELDDGLLSIAKLRFQYYGFNNVRAFLSPSGTELPMGIGQFDFVIMSAVYEHLLPDEREIIIPKIWSIMKPDGILFINQTPYRYFPVESHTTGLPFINYCSDRVALIISRRFSKRVKNSESWETLLRKGIRGATEQEIVRIIRKKTDSNPVLLEPSRCGLNDQINLWYLLSSSIRFPIIKGVLKAGFKIVKFVSGITVIPYLSLAIKKSEEV